MPTDKNVSQLPNTPSLLVGDLFYTLHNNLDYNINTVQLAANMLSNFALTDGQLIIGSTSGVPIAATLTGTSNQISVTNTANTITLALPQNIALASTPTFASETLSTTTNQLVLGTTNTRTINSIAPAASRLLSITDPLGDANVCQIYTGTSGAGDVTKGLKFNTSGATSGKLMTIISSHTDNRSITLPNLTDTLAVIGTDNSFSVAQSLPSINITATSSQLVIGTTNTTTLSLVAPAASRLYTIKDALGDANIVMNYTGASGSGDPTKQIKFNASGATTGKLLTLISSHTDNKSLTFPNVTDTLAVVGTDNAFSVAQTFASGLSVSSGGTVLSSYFAATLNTTLSGIWASPQSVAIKVERIGNFGFIYIPAVTATATIAAEIVTVDALTTNFLPANAQYYGGSFVTDAGAIVHAYVTIGTDGIIHFSKFTDLGAVAVFTGSGTSGVNSMCIPYQIA